MRITLEWAMRQSGANAGLVGVLQNGDTTGVRVMASQGYGKSWSRCKARPLPVLDYKLQDAIEGGLPIRRSRERERRYCTRCLPMGTARRLSPSAVRQIPLACCCSKAPVKASLPTKRMSFLIRLSDHASIAISNAQLYSAVQQANLAKSDFVSFVAHELKNPMTSVKGYTELISAGAVGPITDVQANFLGTIRSNIERMNTLVSDLNDMSKIEVGRLRLDFKSLRLSDSIDTVIRSTKKADGRKTAGAQPGHVPADLPRCGQTERAWSRCWSTWFPMRINIPPPAGTIEVAAERCQNEWDTNGAAEVVHIWVKDNGIGINEEDQKKIFQKFFRSDDPKTREVTGTGLGLNITKSLVEMQGGQIWFESEFRKGTTFHFTVPISET